MNPTSEINHHSGVANSMHLNFAALPYLGAGVIEIGQLQVRLGLGVECDDGLHDLPKHHPGICHILGAVKIYRIVQRRYGT